MATARVGGHTTPVRVLAGACALVAALAGCGAEGPGQPTGSGRVTGRVLAGPTCPVERLQSPCPPRTVAGALVELLRDGQAVASTGTDSRGRFSIAAAPGVLEVRAWNPTGYRSQASQRIVLGPGTTVTVTLVVDTGIR